MIIKKISEEVTSIRKTTEFILEVNDKEVRVYEYINNSDDQWENDVEINETDKKELSEEDIEELEDYLMDCLRLKDGEEVDTDHNPLVTNKE